MSLIHTCALNQVNPFDYLMALDQDAETVTKESAGWFPWNYRRGTKVRDSDRGGSGCPDGGQEAVGAKTGGPLS